MKPQKIARVTGVLFLITFIASLPAYFFYVPVLDDPRYIAGADTGVSLVAFHDWTFLFGPGFLTGVGAHS